jgi:type IV pilus assembly protein PilQ
VNLVIPDYVQGRVTVRLREVPWEAALEVILESELWYRYRREGNVVRVAPRFLLDEEDGAAGERARQAR